MRKNKKKLRILIEDILFITGIVMYYAIILGIVTALIVCFIKFIVN